MNTQTSEGLSAYWDGYAGSSNPYPRKSPESKAWAHGWMNARKEEVELFRPEYPNFKPSVPISE